MFCPKILFKTSVYERYEMTNNGSNFEIIYNEKILLFNTYLCYTIHILTQCISQALTLRDITIGLLLYSHASFFVFNNMSIITRTYDINYFSTIIISYNVILLLVYG